MDYKLTIFGTNVYKEIELSQDMPEIILIGTTSACQVRFNREHFFEDFEIQLMKDGDAFRLGCSSNIYFASEYRLKEYIRVLRHGDGIQVNYDSTDSGLFYIELLFDYDKEQSSFTYRIDLNGLNQIHIGGNRICQIMLTDESIGQDYIILSSEYEDYRIDARNSRYGVYVNGFKCEEPQVLIKDSDFFALVGHQFYLSRNCLYVQDLKYIATDLPIVNMNLSFNALEYPKFVRSTRQKYVLPKEEIEVLSPKVLEAEPKKNLLMTLVPSIMSLLLMVLLRGVMGSGSMFVVYSAAMMLMGIGTSVWTYINDGKEYREKKQLREERYNDYILQQEQKIQQIREKEQKILEQKYLSIEDDLMMVEQFDSRLFEHTVRDDDFLDIYLGRGVKKSECTVKYKAQEYKDTEDELMDYPMYLHDKYEYIDNVPIHVSLMQNPVIGFAGNRSALYQMLKNVVLDLAAKHYHTEVKFYFMIHAKDIEQFQWLRWLRHAYDGRRDSRSFMYDEESQKQVLEFLYGELSRREALPKELRAVQEHYVIFIYRSEVFRLHPASRYVGRSSELGFHFIFFEEQKELLHSACRQIIYLEGNNYQGQMVSSENGEQKQYFFYPHISTRQASAAVHRLGCVYVDEVSLEGNLTKNISLYELMNIMNEDDIDLRKNWGTSKIYETMAAPLGVKSGNEIVYLDLHEKYHGPHGLVAGTTGSGKSEILQTYILSMATLFHPYEVGFVIIDFKGGGMVNQFRELPHLNGAITNIDGREINRSLLSIRAELRKRQELFAKYSVNHIDAYIKKYKSGECDQPLPHLILIVDEFAELKSDQPDFMKELISTARIGRSLGVHLILATQKPSGVVDGQIWSNSKFKLCLKVQNKEDSTEVLKSPLAAEIKEPGRAYLQVGNNEIFQLFQSAYSGAPASRDINGNQKKYRISKMDLSGKRQVIYEQKRKIDENGKTQLEVLVEYIRDYCISQQIEKLGSICQPPLKAQIPYPTEIAVDLATDICVPLGIFDDPNHQRQEEANADFTQDNMFILGSSQYGKTNLLQVMLKGIALKYSPKEVHVYILDFASMFLKNYEKMAHVGGVITSSDDEKLKTFMKMMREEVKWRKEQLLAIGLSSFSSYREAGYKEIPQIVIMIDNLTALRELYEQYEETLLHLCREGISVGISIVAANSQTSGVGYKYLSNFAKRFAFYCNDSSEYGYVFDSCRMEPKNTPGRCLTAIDKVIYETQIYQAYAEEKEAERSKAAAEFIAQINKQYTGMRAKKIPEIPQVLTEQYITDHFAGVLDPYEINLGLDFATTDLLTMSLLHQGMLGLYGRPHGGKQNFINYVLQTLIQRKEEQVCIYIMDDIEKKLQNWKECNSVVQYSLNPQDACNAVSHITELLAERYQMMLEEREEELAEQPLLLLILQNKDAVSAISTDRKAIEEFKQIQSRYRNLRVCVLFTNLDNAPIGFGSPEAVKLFKENKNLLIFENISEQKLQDISLKLSREYAKPLESGEAYYVKGNQLSKIKTVLLR